MLWLLSEHRYVFWIFDCLSCLIILLLIGFHLQVETHEADRIAKDARIAQLEAAEAESAAEIIRLKCRIQEMEGRQE